MKRIATLLGALMLALSFGVAQAAAEEDPGGAEQTAGQSAGSGQDADGNGSAYQSGPTNNAQSIRVLSPGSNGSTLAVEHHDCGGHCRKRKQDGPGHRPVTGWLGSRLRLLADRRPGGRERPGC